MKEIQPNDSYLRILRKQSGMTVNEACAKLNLVPNSLMNYERGLYRLPLTVAYDIAHVYNVPLDDLALRERELRASRKQ